MDASHFVKQYLRFHQMTCKIGNHSLHKKKFKLFFKHIEGTLNEHLCHFQDYFMLYK